MKKCNILGVFCCGFFLFLFESSTSWFRSVLLQQVPTPEQAEFSTEGPQKAALGFSKSKVLFALKAAGNLYELGLTG